MNVTKKNKWNYLILAMELIVFILIDQLTKYAAVICLKGQSSISVLPGILELYYLENHGAAWGILENARIFFLITAVILVGVIWYYYRRIPAEKHWNFCRFLMAMLASGAIGNAIDRFWHGYVVDFLYISVINFPVFNVADCYVTLSVLLFFVYYRKEVLTWIRSES